MALSPPRHREGLAWLERGGVPDRARPGGRPSAGGHASPSPAARGSESSTVDNGFLRFAVGPDHGGSLFELKDGDLKAGGASHLLTSFPTPEPHFELNPWFGGLTPQAWLSPGHHEPRPMAARSYRWSEASRELLGQSWRGVRLSAELDREHNRGLDVEVEYLTLGGSNLVAFVARLDTHGAPYPRRSGVLLLPGAGGLDEGDHRALPAERAALPPAGSAASRLAPMAGARSSQRHGPVPGCLRRRPEVLGLAIDHDEGYLRFYVRGHARIRARRGGRR